MARTTTKTPAEIVAEAQKNLENARLRAAKAAANDNPLIAGLNGVLAQISKDIAKNSRQLAGNNSFDVRIESAGRHLDFLYAERDFVLAQDAELRAKREALNEVIARLAERIANGDNVSDTVESIVSSLPVDERVPALERVKNEANETWRASTPSALAKKSLASEKTATAAS